MAKINAVITGVGGYVPDYVLSNEELSRMVDTSDEWIMTRVGIKERHILTEEGLGTSYMARKAAKQLIKKTGVDPDTIDALIVTTTTPDYKFPSTASIVLGKLGLKNAFAFDLEGSMLRIPLFARRGCHNDREWSLQEDNRYWCRQDVVTRRLSRPCHMCALRRRRRSSAR